MNLLHATTLLDEQRIAVDGIGTVTCSLSVQISNLENVLQAIKSNLNDLVVGAGKEVTQGLDAALSNEVPDLFRLLEATGCGVANGPTGLLAGLEITILQEVDQRRDNVGIDDSLDLRRVTGSDVGNGPAGFLANAILGRAQKRQEAWESAAVDDDLGLDIVASNNVTNGSKSGGLNGSGCVQEKLDESAGDTGFDNGLDLVVGAIREIRNSPAGIDQDLVIKRVDELGQNGKCRGNL